jgi:alkylation response protein AidB-like acyl-CoA dehydrogenase
MYFPAPQMQILDTWHVIGLEGTGSNDIAVEQLFVPDGYSIGLGVDRPVNDGALYRLPVFGFLACSVSAVMLGIARAAIDSFTAFAAAKVPRGARRPLADHSTIQAQLAQAEGLLGSGRALFYDQLGRVWDQAVRGDRPTPGDRAHLRVAATTAARNSVAAVDILFELAGASAVYDTSALQRQFRDIRAAGQHAAIGPRTLELAGRVLLGLETDTSLL